MFRRTAALRLLLALTLTCLVGSSFAQVRLDSTFGVGGRVLVDGPRFLDYPSVRLLRTAPDGSMLVAIRDGRDSVIERRLPDGSRDAAFGGEAGELRMRRNGALARFVSDIEYIRSGPLTGYAYVAIELDACVLTRIDARGRVDRSFGADGFAVGTDYGCASHIVVDGDVAIVMSRNGARIVRYTLAGARDGTFGIAGVADLPGTSKEGAALMLESGVLTAVFDTTGRVNVARLGSSSGLLLPAFDGDGVWNTLSLPQTFAASVDNGRTALFWLDGRIMRLMPDGSRDASFAPNGDCRPTLPAFPDFELGTYGSQPKLRRVGDRYLFPAAFVQGLDYRAAVVAFRADACGVDTTFGQNGIAVAAPGEAAWFSSLADLENRGDRLVIAGNRSQDPGVFAMSMSGEPLPLGAATVVATFPTQRSWTFLATDVIGMASGYVVPGELTRWLGDEYNPSLLRLRADGSRDTSFGAEGYRQFGRSCDRDSPRASVAGEVIVFAQTGLEANACRVQVRRFLSGGADDPSFGTNGVVTLDPGVGSFRVSGVSQLADGSVLVGVQRSSSSFTSGHAVFRLQSNGQLDAGFGAGGRLAVLAADFGGELSDLRVAGTQFQVASGSSVIRVHSFDVATGLPDAGFGPNGVGYVDLPYSNYRETPRLLALGDDTLVTWYTEAGVSAANRCELVKVSSQGVVDGAFAGTSILETQCPEDESIGIATEPENTIVVAGIRDHSQYPRGIVIERFDASGANVPIGGQPNVAMDLYPGASHDLPNHAVVDARGMVMSTKVAGWPGRTIFVRFARDGSDVLLHDSFESLE